MERAKATEREKGEEDVKWRTPRLKKEKVQAKWTNGDHCAQPLAGWRRKQSAKWGAALSARPMDGGEGGGGWSWFWWGGR